jgi:hypothetical protein
MEVEREADAFLKHAERGYECRISVLPNRGIVTLTDLTDEGY